MSLTKILFSTPMFSIMKGVRTRGDTPSYNKLYRYVPPQRVGFLGFFGLKTLCSFCSGIGYGFRGNYGGVHVLTYLSFEFHMNNNKREICKYANSKCV